MDYFKNKSEELNEAVAHMDIANVNVHNPQVSIFRIIIRYYNFVRYLILTIGYYYVIGVYIFNFNFFRSIKLKF